MEDGSGWAGLSIAVLVPCRNEAPTVARVVEDFQAAVPGCHVYVYDNASTDDTAAIARAAGARVRTERRPGKGNVVRRMFADVEADVFIMVDGDGTYEAAAAPRMLDLLVQENLDMVVGARESAEPAASYRAGHVLGNWVFTRILRALFGGDFSDVFSGYRVMSRRLVKSFPASSSGFEIETEITAHALDVHAPSAEVVTGYGERDAGSASKLRTWRDGGRILRSSLVFYKELRPLRFFGAITVLLTLIALAIGIPVVLEYVDTGLVPRFPTAILASALQIAAVISLTSGIILDSLGRARREAKMLAYLAQRSVSPVVTPAHAP